MKKLMFNRVFLFFLWTVLTGGPTVPIVQAYDAPRVVPGVIVVKYRDESAAVSAVNPMSKASAVILETRKLFPEEVRPEDPTLVNLSTIYELKFSGNIDPFSLAAEFNELPDVEYAEPVYIRQLCYTPNDPQFVNQAYLSVIKAKEAWDLVKGDHTVIIGIVDSGVDWNHPDLVDNIWQNLGEDADGDGRTIEFTGGEWVLDPGDLNRIDDDDDGNGNGKVDDLIGWDFIGASFSASREDNDPDPKQGNAHGTHVAGLASAVSDNAIGIASIGFNCRIMVTKHGIDTPGETGLAFGYLGIKYMVDNGADIINCSWGSISRSQAEQDIINYAFQNKCLVVAAAGNNDDPNVTYSPPDTPPAHYPSCYDHVLSVANIRTNDQFYSGSLWGPDVDVCAPGVELLSTVIGGNYASRFWTGTSMSSPLVAGLAGLLKKQHPEWLPDQIVNQIKFTAEDVSLIGNNQTYIDAGGIGSGRINAYQAVNPANQSLPKIAINEIVVDDSRSGNNNGIAEPGETINLIIGLENTWADVFDLKAILSTDDVYIQLISNSATYPLLLGASALGLNTMNNKHQPFIIRISEEAYPHPVSFTLNLSTSSGYSDSFQVNVAIQSGILLVDDDDGSDYEQYYREVLNELRIGHTYWNHAIQNSPDFSKLNYRTVIWITNYASPTLNKDDRDHLTYLLNSGANLLITGQRVGYDLGQAFTSGNEYKNSSGKSKTFYETYLHAKFITDKTEHRNVNGVANDPIGDALNFSVWQPDHGSDKQTPAEIQSLAGSIPILTYPNGQNAGIRFENTHKVVYFAFGGIEGIREEESRRELLKRVIDYFSGLTIDVNPVKDTEDTKQSFPVIARIGSRSPIAAVDLYWDTDGALPFHKLPMAETENGIYSVEIPSQSLGTTVDYFVVARDQSGFYERTDSFSFTVDLDNIAPEFSGLSSPGNQLSNRGPFRFEMKAEDNLGIDTTSAMFFYWSKTIVTDSILMDYLGNGQFKSIINGSLQPGDTLFYQYAIKDVSQNRNRGSSPIGYMFVGLEDFESGLDGWTTEQGGWNLEAFRPKSGAWLIHESPGAGVVYPDSADLKITYTKGIDLSAMSGAALSFWHFYGLLPNDIGYVEVSSDGGDQWVQVSETFYGNQTSYKQEIVSLNQFAGAGHDSLLLRFRFVSDASGAGPGWYIDDVQIFPYQTGLGGRPIAEVPTHFALHENYPNPFNPGTWISYALPEAAQMTLTIYNILGQPIKVMCNDHQSAGMHRVFWNGLDERNQTVPSGLYFYKMKTGKFEAIRKMTLMR